MAKSYGDIPDEGLVPVESFQKEVYDAVQSNLAALLKQTDADHSKAGTSGFCVPTAVLTFAELRTRGYPCKLCAGNMAWPMVPRNKATPDSDSHVAYTFDPESKDTLDVMDAGDLPELHCWVVIESNTDVVVDMSVGTIKQSAIEAGHFWQNEDPPQWLWAQMLPDGVYYGYDWMASGYIHGWLERSPLLSMIERINPVLYHMVRQELRRVKQEGINMGYLTESDLDV